MDALSDKQRGKLTTYLDWLSEEIWDVDGLESAAMAVDAIAAILTQSSRQDSAESVFADLEWSEAAQLASDLASIASERLYDDDDETEEKLTDAEGFRSELHDLLTDLISEMGGK